MSPEIEIRHLRYFLAVADTENFTRAAERLGVTQPSISQQIRDLENELGTTLFQRLGKRVRMTDAGIAFRQRADVVMRKMEEACASVTHVPGQMSGHIDVGVIPALHLSAIPPVLARFAKDFPSVTVAVHERASRYIEVEIEAGRYDFGFGLMTNKSPNLRCETILSEELALIVRGDHPHASKSELPIRDLEKQPISVLPESFDMRQLVEGLYERVKLRPKIAFEISTIDSALHTVVHSGIPTILPPIVLKGREALHLRSIKLTGSNRKIDFGLIFARGSKPIPAVAEFVSALRAVMAQPVAHSVKGPGKARKD